MKSSAAVFAILIGLCGLILGCEKVPLRENPGHFDVLAAHYFENEKTQYVFYSISGLRPEQAALSWPSRFEFKLSEKSGEFAPVDEAKAVHRHALVACGEGRLCGSYSFRTDAPPGQIAIRFRYHQESAMNLESKMPNSIHPSGDTASSQSALVHGVFSKENERIQIRIHDNFGTPNSEQIRDFGMQRDFDVTNLASASLTPSDRSDLQRRTGSSFLFPADAIVGSLAAVKSTASQRISGSSGWLPDQLDSRDPMNVAVFRARFLDRAGTELRSAYGLSNRNPVLQFESVSVQSSLHDARKIPLIISYCSDRPESASQTSQLFLDYQRFVLGFPQAPVDVCFSVGEEERFSHDLQRVIRQKITQARSAGNAADFFFTVAINHRLSPVVVHFHQTIIAQLANEIRQERVLVSPRLVGAFVYDSDALENRPFKNEASDTQTGLVWCPQLDPKNPLIAASEAAGVAGCSSYGGGKFEIGPASFLLPMGPFPTLTSYVDHVGTHGNKGIALNPRFQVKSIRTNSNSKSDSDTNATSTFFDGERVQIPDGGALRFCRDLDTESLLANVAVRVRDEKTQTFQILNIDEAQPLVLSGQGNVDIGLGLRWDYPFIGGLSYDSPVQGKVLKFIPIQRTFGDAQKVGDQRWTRQSWPIGPLLQKCTRHCDNPYFDEAGIYQKEYSWRHSFGRCFTPKIEEPPGA